MSKMLMLEPADIKVVKNLNYRQPEDTTIGRRKITELVEQFIAEGHDCCRIAIYNTNHEAHCEASIFRRAVLSARLDNTVRVVRRGSELYLANKRKWESIPTE